MAPLDDLRQRLGGALRDRVAGPGAEARAAQLLNAPGPRWFDDDRPIRAVHADASMFIGGLRALLLQTLHPRAMAGVAQHSDYRADPWGRLQRTADFLATTTYGTAETAQQTVDRVIAVHRRVTGTTRDGQPYSASDPHLLRWVHVAEVDSFISAHRAYGALPLGPDGYDGYVADMAVVARALGVPAPPTSERALADQLAAFRHELRSTPESRDAVRYLVTDPPLPLPARPVYGALVAAAIATLPAWTRPMLRLPGLPVAELLALRPLGSLVTGAIRWATFVDSPFRQADAASATNLS
jgi:uncharacterized protein (DUF2236 family)